MLDFSASPSILPSTGQAPETADMPQTPLETPSEGGEEGFFSLLASSLQPTTESQNILGEPGEFIGPETDLELPESGMMLPRDAAAGVLPLPGALSSPQGAAPGSQSPLTQPLVQTTDGEEAAYSGLPPRQPLVKAVRSLLTQKGAPKTTSGPEHWQLNWPGTAGSVTNQASGPVNLLPQTETATVKEHLLGVAKGMETMPLMRPSTPLGDQPMVPSAALAAAGTTAATAAAEQAPAVKMSPVYIAVGEKGWDQSVGERITWMLGNRIQQAEVRLSPPHLGPLEIRVSVQSDQASVSIAAPHVLTREAIEAAIPRLREMMQEGNLNLVNVNVEDRSPGQHNTAGESGEGGDEGAAQAQADKATDSKSGLETEKPRTATTGLVDDYA